MGVTSPWCLALVAGVLTAVASAPGAATITIVKGEVVHLECPLQKDDGGRGEAHARCAMDCAREGKPMAILAADAVYLIEGDYTANTNAKLLDFVARQVEAKGTVRDDAGTLHINVAAMMVQKP